MQTSAFWRRLDLPGHDVARLRKSAFGWELSGIALFRHADGIAELRYEVDADRDWNVVQGAVQGWIGIRPIVHRIERTPEGWLFDRKHVAGLDHLDTLDLSFTPATNLLQLRRSGPAVGATADIPAAWFNLDDESLTELQQTYFRDCDTRYRYSAPSLDYATMLTMGADGFVSDYPDLWVAE